MKHSVIFKVGTNLVYQQAPMPKPMIESSSSPTEFNRALPEWEHTAKNYLIQPKDQEAFKEYLDSDLISIGVPVPYELVEFYEEGEGYPKKKYARRNNIVIQKNNDGSAAAITMQVKCKVCEESRAVPFGEKVFEICDQCLKDLGEIVMERRSLNAEKQINHLNP